MKNRFERTIDAANEQKLGASPRCLLMILVFLAWDKKSIAVSIPELAAAYGTDQRNLIRTLGILKGKHGLIRVDGSMSPEGQRQPNRYSFPFLDGGPLQPVAPLVRPVSEMESL